MLRETLFLMGLSLSLSANAVIQDLGNITRDTTTGLDWLDVTETRGLSYDQVTAELGLDGDYEGYRYATMAELDQLIINFGYTAINSNCPYTALHCDTSISGDSLLIEHMIRTLGDTYDAVLDESASINDIPLDGAGATSGILGSQNYHTGLYDFAVIGDAELSLRAGGEYREDNLDTVQTAYGDWSSSQGDPGAGSFLVASSPVPIPAAGWLFISALVGLVGKKRLSH